MSKRAQVRKRQLQRKSTQRLIMVGSIVLLSVIVAGAIIWQSNKPIGEIVQVEIAPPRHANGKSLGAADAPVVIHDFSNFT